MKKLSKEDWGLKFLFLVVLFLYSLPLNAKPRNPFLDLDFFVGVQEVYDDNVFQVESPTDSDFVTTIGPGVNANFQPFNFLKLGANYKAEIFIYPSFSELNDILHKFDFDIGINFGKTRRFRNFRLDTEVDYTPTDISATNSSGTTINSTQKLRLAVIPGYLWKLTPKMDLDFEARLERQWFFGELGEDNSIGELVVTLRRRLGRRIFLSLAGNGGIQKFDDLGNTFLIGGDGGIDIEFYKRLNGSVSAGYQFIDLPQDAGSNGTYTIAADLQYLLSKRTRFSVDFNRSNTVDIRDNPYETNIANMSIEHRLSLKTLLALDLFWQYTDLVTFSIPLGGLVGDDLMSLGTKLRMQFTDHWTFSIFYSRDKNGGEDTTNDYTQNRFGGEIEYHFPLQF